MSGPTRGLSLKLRAVALPVYQRHTRAGVLGHTPGPVPQQCGDNLCGVDNPPHQRSYKRVVLCARCTAHRRARRRLAGLGAWAAAANLPEGSVHNFFYLDASYALVPGSWGYIRRIKPLEDLHFIVPGWRLLVASERGGDKLLDKYSEMDNGY